MDLRRQIVETDNYGGDYPDEKFLNVPYMLEEKAKAVCNLLNSEGASRYWKVVGLEYKLVGGFEP